MKKPVKLWTLDTETRGLFGELFRVGMYNGLDYFAFSDFNSIMDALEDYSEYENHIYIHNLDFDLAKIAPNLFNRDSVNFGKSIIINGTIAVLYTDTMVLHDSLKLLPSSLDKLCKDFDIKDNKKKDLTEYIIENGYAIYNEDGSYNKKDSLGNFFEKVPAEDEVLNEYLMYDCISLYEIIQKLIIISGLSPNEIVFCPTTPSLAMKVFKTQYKEDYEQAIKTKYVGERGQFAENFLRCGYYGGRTEVFKPVMENGYHYDVNSLYPFVMKYGKYPVGDYKILDAEESKKKYDVWKLRGHGGGVLYCKIYVPETLYIPPLPRHDPSGKLLFPVGHLMGAWTLIELKEAERVGCVIEEFIQMIYFPKMVNLFEKFISHFEQIKINSHGAKRTFAKLMQNSLYGKFGMNRQRTTYADISQLGKIKEDGTVYRVHHHTKNLMNLKFVEYVTESKARYIQPQIASYVTAYARILLYRGLLAQQETGEVSYCDTDSIASTGTMPDDKVHDSEYGKWKLESVIEKGIFLQPKFYAERPVEGKDTIRAKGIPSSERTRLTFENYEQWLEVIRTGEEDRIFIFDNLPARRKFLSSLKNNSGFDEKVFLRKCINVKLEQKRKMDYVNNTTQPHVRNDYGELADSPTNQMTPDFFETLLTFTPDDIDIVKELIEEYGYIRTISKKSPLFQLYNKVDKKTKRKYFRRNGIDIEEICKVSGWDPVQLLNEMEW